VLGEFPSNPVSIKDCAAYFNVSRDTIRRAIARGDLKAYRVGTKIIRVDMDDAAGLFRTIPTVGSEAS
jgi:excisionase family DNA binding protein